VVPDSYIAIRPWGKDVRAYAAGSGDPGGIRRNRSRVVLLQELADWDRLADLIHRMAPRLLEQGRGETLEAWLRHLPEDRLRELP
jgi:hypothetical protein